MKDNISMHAFKTLEFRAKPFEVVAGTKLIVIRREKQEITVTAEEFELFVELMNEVKAERAKSHAV